MNKINFDNLNGLIPAVIQDNNTLQVLMVGFMNEESYLKTIETKKVWFYSRSKKRLWMKGEKSGNYLNTVEIKADCDADSLLIMVNQSGPTCHTGEISCFSDNKADEISKLYSTIEKRKDNPEENSYTASLFKDGLNKICCKIAEESGEVIKAATKESKVRLREESIDLLFHLLVLCVYKGISFENIIKEIKKRKR